MCDSLASFLLTGNFHPWNEDKNAYTMGIWEIEIKYHMQKQLTLQAYSVVMRKIHPNHLIMCVCMIATCDKG